MRLPFGLGRRSGSADGATGDGSTAGSEGSRSSASSGASAPASLPTRAWASLPAIQRTTGDMPLVASPATFVDALPGSQGLPPIVEPLGHEVSALATPGLVVARSRAVEAPAPGSIPAPAPVQRRASRTAAASGTVDAAYEAFDETPVDVAAPAPVAAQGPMPSVAAPSAPIRTMPTVSRQAIHVPDRPLTSAAAAAQPASVQRSSASAPAAPGGAPTSALPRPSGGMRRVPAPTPTPQVSRQAAETGPAPSPSPTAAAVPATTAPVIGPARRGLGEPLDAAPASARPVAAAHAGPVVSRSTTSGPLPMAASSLLPVAQRSAATPGDRPALGPGGGAPDLSRTPPAPLPQPALRLPHLPVSRSADGTSHAPATTAPAAMPAPVNQGPTIRPTTGANPLRTSLAIQRSAADDADDAEPESELPSPWWSSEPAATADVARNPMGPAAADAAPPATISVRRPFWRAVRRPPPPSRPAPVRSARRPRPHGPPRAPHRSSAPQPRRRGPARSRSRRAPGCASPRAARTAGATRARA